MTDHDAQADEPTEQEGRQRKKRARHGDGLIILFFVVGLAGVLIGFIAQMRLAAWVGAALLVIGVVALVAPRGMAGAADSAPVWECPSCGYVFEKQVKHPRSTLHCDCPRCGKAVSCRSVKRGS